jgi:hypothetical protein
MLELSTIFNGSETFGTLHISAGNKRDKEDIDSEL